MPRSTLPRPAPLVSIVIPTQRRPGPLDSAVASALEQQTDDFTVEVVIVDNDPAGSARPQAARLAKGAAMSVRYVHAPEPGVANARNAGTAAARGHFIAFLDDDEIASPGWLSSLIEVQRLFDADVAFGPVRAHLPERPIRHRDYLTSFFSRLGPDEACTILDGPGCGNSLVRKEAMPRGAEPFARERNGIGGEDDLLFATMKTAGARFAWAPDAWVWELPEPSRLSLDYTLRRAFAFGQGPASAAWARGPQGWPLAPVWMAIGALQVLLYGGRAVIDAMTRSPDLAYTLDHVAQGLGKVLWFPPFKIRFYGQPAQAAPALVSSISAPPPVRQGETHERHQPLEPRPGRKLRPRQPPVPA